MKFSLSNFNAQNTPISLQKIGNMVLLAGTIALIVLGLPPIINKILPADMPTFVLPGFIVAICRWLIAAGVAVKSATKLWGVSSPEELQKLVDKTNKKLNDTTGNTIATDPLKIIPPPPHPEN